MILKMNKLTKGMSKRGYRYFRGSILFIILATHVFNKIKVEKKIK